MVGPCAAVGAADHARRARPARGQGRAAAVRVPQQRRRGASANDPPRADPRDAGRARGGGDDGRARRVAAAPQRMESRPDRALQRRRRCADVPWPRDQAGWSTRSIAGASSPAPRARDARDRGDQRRRQGWRRTIARCVEGGGEAEVALGWSKARAAVIAWDGAVQRRGRGPAARTAARSTPRPPHAGPGAARPARPASDLPNNHLSYAVQWFFFALTALVIYILALRKRWKSSVLPRGACPRKRKRAATSRARARARRLASPSRRRR